MSLQNRELSSLFLLACPISCDFYYVKIALFFRFHHSIARERNIACNAKISKYSYLQINYLNYLPYYPRFINKLSLSTSCILSSFSSHSDKVLNISFLQCTCWVYSALSSNLVITLSCCCFFNCYEISRLPMNQSLLMACLKTNFTFIIATFL